MLSQDPVVDKYLRMLKEACDNDTVFKRIKDTYAKKLNNRVMQIEKRLQRKLRDEERIAFRLRLKKAGVPVMPQQTHRFNPDPKIIALNAALSGREVEHNDKGQP